MNATTARATQDAGAPRSAAILLILVVTAVAGLAVGTLIQQAGDDRSSTGAATSAGSYYWPAEPLSQHTPTTFEMVAPAEWPDYGLRLRIGSDAASSDTFRLTGPSQVQAATDAVQRSNANQGENEPVQLRRQPN